MNPMKIAAVAAATMLFSGSMQAQMANHGMEMKADKNIVEVATGAGFNTLVAAVKAAGLVDALSGKGPFTVFAPTDAAFAKLPAGTLDALLKDPVKLGAILKYHVVSGKVMAADVIKAKGAKPATLNGAALDIAVKDGKVHVNGATVTSADVMASNGVIHVIDMVVLPPASK
jgi:uncharacterized surface protein with fasciclin (FAS1) repeats